MRSTFAQDCHAKIIENSFENRSRRVLGASRTAPGGLRESSRHASIISARFCDPKGQPRETEFSHFWPQSGARPDPENRPKIDFLRKKGRRVGKTLSATTRGTYRYFLAFIPFLRFPQPMWTKGAPNHHFHFFSLKAILNRPKRRLTFFLNIFP